MHHSRPHLPRMYHQGYGSQPHGFDTHGMSQWATRKATDLADMRDPQPDVLSTVQAEHEHRLPAEANLGAIAVNQAIPEQYR